MISTTQDEIDKTFAAVSGDPAPDLEGLVKSLSDVVAEVSRVQPTENAQPQTTLTSAPGSDASGGGAVLDTVESLVSTVFRTVAGTPSPSGSGGGGVLDTVESVASTVLKSGFGIVPLVGELFGLFGGGDSAAPAPLVKYAMPSKLTFEAAETGSGLSNVDYDQSGMPRAYTSGSSSDSGIPSNATPSPQITVNVQAMDARSFLDRSSDIAAAVRDAMLSLSSINDVINDL